MVVDDEWNKDAQDRKFGVVGNKVYTLEGGKNYNNTEGSSGNLTAGLSGLVAGYELFENTEEYDIDFLLMGSGAHSKEVTQALANKIISVAEIRKDAIAFISPNRTSFMQNGGTSTANILSSSPKLLAFLLLAKSCSIKASYL